MICDRCKKRQACVHITKLVNDDKSEQHLCEICAKEVGEAVFEGIHGLSVHDFLKGMFNSGLLQHQPAAGGAACPECGMLFNDFSRTGKMGCGGCYEAFAGQIAPLLRRIHGTRGHTGKVPGRIGGRVAAKNQLARLRQELQQLVAQEEYEKAAVIRDHIKDIEQKLDRESEKKDEPV